MRNRLSASPRFLAKVSLAHIIQYSMHPNPNLLSSAYAAPYFERVCLLKVTAPPPLYAQLSQPYLYWNVSWDWAVILKAN